MKKILRFKIGLGLFLFPYVLLAQCPIDAGAREIDIWNMHNCDTEFSNWVKLNMNMNEVQWNEGWGWDKCDPAYAFPKMLNATFVMTYGIEDQPKDLDENYLWSAENLTFRTSQYSKSDEVEIWSGPEVIKVGKTIHVFGTTLYTNKLVHYWSENPGFWNVENITNNFDPEFRIYYFYKAISGSDGNIHVFGINSDQNLIHYFKKDGQNWNVENITTTYDFGINFKIESNIILTEAMFKTNNTALTNMIHIFGTNNNRGCSDCWSKIFVHYFYNPITKVWGGEVDTFYNYKFARLYNHIIDNNNNIYIFSEEAAYGKWSPTNGWIFSDFDLYSDFAGWEMPYPIISADGTLCVFAKNSDGDLVKMTPNGLYSWTTENITQKSNIGDAYRIAFNPSACVAENNLYVFAGNSNGEIIAYTYDRGWWAINLSKHLNLGYKVKTPCFEPAIIVEGSIINLFTKSWTGLSDLIQLSYYKNTGWRFTNLTAGRTSKRIGGKIVALINSENNWFDKYHVFSLKDTYNSETYSSELIHYSTARYAFSWHTSQDYYNWAAGIKYDFRYQPKEDSIGDDNSETLGKSFCGVFRTNRVEMWCPSFKRSAGIRAGVMLHEATHIIYGDLVDIWQHNKDKDIDRDKWFHHKLDAFQRGKLDPYVQIHSMYQMEVEFLADIAEFAKPWIPWQVSNDARDRANYLINTRFTNDVGWVVGDPRPISY